MSMKYMIRVGLKQRTESVAVEDRFGTRETPEKKLEKVPSDYMRLTREKYSKLYLMYPTLSYCPCTTSLAHCPYFWPASYELSERIGLAAPISRLLWCEVKVGAVSLEPMKRAGQRKR